jgi:hypothetical protein
MAVRLAPARLCVGIVAGRFPVRPLDNQPAVCLHSDFCSFGFAHGGNRLPEPPSKVLTTNVIKF